MSFISRSLLLVPVAAAIAFACSSTTEPTPGDDAGTSDAAVADSSTTPDTSTAQDSSTTPDTSTPDSSAPTCTNNGFTSVATDGFVRGSGEVGVVGQTTLAAPVDTLELSLLPLTGNTVVAGKRTLAAADGSYDTCTTCILIRTKCDAGLANCAKTFIATAGTLDILNAPTKGAKFQVKADVQMVEVTIDAKNVTTKVPNGETWCLAGKDVTVDSMQ